MLKLIFSEYNAYKVFQVNYIDKVCMYEMMMNTVV